jgi:hypothetical protein
LKKMVVGALAGFEVEVTTAVNVDVEVAVIA